MNNIQNNEPENALIDPLRLKPISGGEYRMIAARNAPMLLSEVKNIEPMKKSCNYQFSVHKNN
jgi:hypothetical protein